MGDTTDWSAVLDALLTEVREDEACKKLIDDLHGYAVYAVTKHEADIKDTLKNRVKAPWLKVSCDFLAAKPGLFRVPESYKPVGRENTQF